MLFLRVRVFSADVQSTVPRPRPCTVLLLGFAPRTESTADRPRGPMHPRRTQPHPCNDAVFVGGSCAQLLACCHRAYTASGAPRPTVRAQRGRRPLAPTTHRPDRRVCGRAYAPRAWPARARAGVRGGRGALCVRARPAEGEQRCAPRRSACARARAWGRCACICVPVGARRELRGGWPPRACVRQAPGARCKSKTLRANTSTARRRARRAHARGPAQPLRLAGRTAAIAGRARARQGSGTPPRSATDRQAEAHD